MRCNYRLVLFVNVVRIGSDKVGGVEGRKSPEHQSNEAEYNREGTPSDLTESRGSN